MRLGISYNLFDGEELLEKSIKNILEKKLWTFWQKILTQLR